MLTTFNAIDQFLASLHSRRIPANIINSYVLIPILLSLEAQKQAVA